jgi:pilus assembly protein CpaB
MNINLRAVVPIIIALIVAGVAAMLARSLLHTKHPSATVASTEKPVAAIEIVVAKDNLPAGYILQPKDMRWQAWPDKALANDYIVKSKGGSIESLQNAVIRRGVAAGEPLTWGRVVKKGDRGYLAAILAPGMRAFSVRISDISGVSGLVFPGDRIDLIMSHKVTKKDSKGEDTTNAVSETILTNIRILAIDQKTDDQDGKPIVAKTATLEVTPKQAEEVALAGNIGELVLSLHSLAQTPEEMLRIADKGPVSTAPEIPERSKSYTWDSQLSHVIPAAGGNQVEVKVGRGDKTEIVQIRR